MKKRIASVRKGGFTLIEVLVTTVIIAVLAAVVIPAVTAQVSAGDSTRVLGDLNDVRTGIENFDIAVKTFPGDVGDLVYKITTADKDVRGTLFTTSQTTNWAGPYIETTTPSTFSADANTSGSAFNTGYTAAIDNKFVACQIGSSTLCDSTGASGDYVVIHINSLTTAQAQAVNDLIDGAGEANSSSTGKFRCCSASSTGFYYATPVK